jgi:hypothetical protein
VKIDNVGTARFSDDFWGSLRLQELQKLAMKSTSGGINKRSDGELSCYGVEFSNPNSQAGIRRERTLFSGRPIVQSSYCHKKFIDLVLIQYDILQFYEIPGFLKLDLP